MYVSQYILHYTPDLGNQFYCNSTNQTKHKTPRNYVSQMYVREKHTYIHICVYMYVAWTVCQIIVLTKLKVHKFVLY